MENSHSDTNNRSHHNLQSANAEEPQMPESDLERGLPKTENPSIDLAGNQKDSFLVKFDKNDPDNPKNFHSVYKAWLALQMAMLAFVGSLGSSIIAPAEPVIASYVGVSLEVTVLTVSLFVLGYAFGPILWAPVGEVYGRRISMLPPVFILGLFSVGTATSKNAASVFITRFLGGVFASAPVSNISAAIGDIYEPKHRGVPMAFMSASVVGGPCLAPVIGAALTTNTRLGWRCTEYIQAIVTFTAVGVAFFGLPETYAPVLLKRKAQQMRKMTNVLDYWHSQELEKMKLDNIVPKYLGRPMRMLFTEPMVTCIACYASFVYGLLFFQIESCPIVFQENRKWGLIVSTLPFLGLFVGVIIAIFINYANQPFYAKAVARNNGRAVPEARLPPMVIGGVLFSSGLFWFGWTAAPTVPWIVPVIAAGFIGAGFSVIFQQCLNYLADTYGPFAASAMAGNTFLRSLLAAGLPLAARPMFLNLGVGPACSFLGGVSCLALPVPLIFMKYSLTLRKKSKFSPEPQD